MQTLQNPVGADFPSCSFSSAEDVCVRGEAGEGVGTEPVLPSQPVASIPHDSASALRRMRRHLQPRHQDPLRASNRRLPPSANSPVQAPSAGREALGSGTGLLYLSATQKALGPGDVLRALPPCCPLRPQ